MCPERWAAHDAASLTPCCTKQICDLCLCTYLTSFHANNLPLTCPFGCHQELGLHFFFDLVEERPNDETPSFLKLTKIFKKIVNRTSSD